MTNVRAFGEPGERVENATTEDIRGGAEECMNVVKYYKTGERGRETWRVGAMCRRVVGTR